MKIAVSARQPNLDSEIDPRFGRCRYFVFVDPQTLDFTEVENPNAAVEGGAGIGTAQFVVQQGAQIVITGNLGPKAHQALSAAGVRMFTGVGGKIRQALDDYHSGRFQAGTAANATGKRAQEVRTAAGAGMGQGRGGGCGRGRGRGRGACWEPGSGARTAAAKDVTLEASGQEGKYAETPGKETLEELKERVNLLNEALSKVQQRIRELEQR